MSTKLETAQAEEEAAIHKAEHLRNVLSTTNGELDKLKIQFNNTNKELKVLRNVFENVTAALPYCA